MANTKKKVPHAEARFKHLATYAKQLNAYFKARGQGKRTTPVYFTKFPKKKFGLKYR